MNGKGAVVLIGNLSRQMQIRSPMPQQNTITVRALAVLVAFLFIPLCAQAHKDRVLKLEGKLIEGLPTEYQPATLDTSQALLAIAGKELLLPRFLKDAMAGKGGRDLKLTSSWYHTPQILPPYISIDIDRDGRDFSYSVLVDMVEVKILKIELRLKETELITRRIPIDPSYWKHSGRIEE